MKTAIRQFAVRIRGTSPLLLNRLHESAAEETLGRRRSGNALAGNPDEWKTKYWCDSTIGAYLPSTYLQAALTKAGAYFVFKGKQSEKARMASLIIDPPAIQIKVDGSPIMTEAEMSQYVWKTFVRQSAPVMRFRPRLPNWSMEFEITVTDPSLPEQLLSDALQVAGLYVGIGDWRPSSPKPGPHGRFVAEVREIS